MNTDDKNSPKDRRREKTRKEILKAAAQVFATKGFHEATIQEIARVAEFSAGSLYNYFKNKEALYNDLLEDVHESFAERLIPPDPDLPFRQRLGVLIENLFRFADDYRNHFQFFAVLHWSGGLTLRREHGVAAQKRQEMLGRFIYDFLDDSVKRGQLPKQDPEDGAVLIVGVLMAFAFRWFHGYGEDLMVDCTDKVLNLVLHGIRYKEE